MGSKVAMTATEHVLDTRLLSERDFERFCLALLMGEGYTDVEHVGSGGHDLGTDIRYWSADGAELWLAQCKRMAHVGPTAVVEIIRLILDRAPQLPAGIHIMASCTISRASRDKARALVAGKGIRLRFHDRTELDALAHRHPDVVAQYFTMPTRLRRHVPRGLPPLLSGLVNRTRELAAMDGRRDRAIDQGHQELMLLTGLHGVGKTTLARAWALKNRSRFAGGDLYGDFSVRRRGVPVDVDLVLAAFLNDLGVPASEVGADFATRCRQFQRATADRQMLVVLDDVEHAAQVTQLIPTGAGSVVVVTSNYLLEEVVNLGGYPMPVGALDAAASRAMLLARIDEVRIEAEPGFTDELIRLCAGLPLALSVCAAKLANDNWESVRSLVGRIRAAAQPLAEISGGGAESLTAVLQVAYSDLSDDAAKLYRLLSTFPGTSVPVQVLAALTAFDRRRAEVALQDLVRVNLVERPDPHTVRLHRLVAWHGQSVVEPDTIGSHPERDQAIQRVADWYMAALHEADLTVAPGRLRLPIEHSAAPEVPVFAGKEDALQWFSMEAANILAVQRAAFDREWYSKSWQFAVPIWPLAFNLKLLNVLVETNQVAIAAAINSGDRFGVARCQSQLANAWAEQGRVDQASAEIDLALESIEPAEHDALRASIFEFAGLIRARQGDNRSAQAFFEQAKALFSTDGQVRGVAIQDYQLGRIAITQRRFDDARALLERALSGFESVGDDLVAARVLIRLGEAHNGLDQWDLAREVLLRALDLLGMLSLPLVVAKAYEVLAETGFAQLGAEGASAELGRAAAIYRRLERDDEVLRVESRLAKLTTR